MPRVRLVNLKLGDPDDVEIYAGAACWDWMQKEQWAQIQKYGITNRDLFWVQGPMEPHSITVDIIAEVDQETAAMLKLAGLTS
jgi:hypothetical protein